MRLSSSFTSQFTSILEAKALQYCEAPRTLGPKARDSITWKTIPDHKLLQQNQPPDKVSSLSNEIIVLS